MVTRDQGRGINFNLEDWEAGRDSAWKCVRISNLMNNSDPTNDNPDPSCAPSIDAAIDAAIEPATVTPASLNRFMRVAPEGIQPEANRPEAKQESNAGANETDRDSMAIASPFPRRTIVKEYSLELAKAAAQVAIDNKGEEVLILDVCDQTALFDYFVIATGTSRRQLHAISEEIDNVLEKGLKDRRLGIEGYEDSRWIVLDYGSVVIHLFDKETRSYYDLESLWGDAKVVPLSELGNK